MATELAEQLLHLRGKYNLTQREMADITGVSASMYHVVESGVANRQSNTSKKIESNLNERAMKSYTRERMKKLDKYRIPNIPNFYEQLDALCNKEGRLDVDKNPKGLLKLQKALGVKRGVNRTGPRRKKRAFSEQQALGRILRGFRGNMSQRELAEKLGIGQDNYGKVERGEWTSRSKAMKTIVRHEYYTVEQREIFKRAYDKLRTKEMEQ